MMGVVPTMHTAIRAGTVPAPGLYMMNNGGLMAFLGGLVGHMLFGFTVAFVYGLFV